MHLAKCLRGSKVLQDGNCLYEFPKLRELVKRDSLWTNSYFVGTAGSVSAETIQHYIETQSG